MSRTERKPCLLNLGYNTEIYQTASHIVLLFSCIFFGYLRTAEAARLGLILPDG